MAGGRIWTDKEIEIVTEGYKNHNSISEIAKKLPGRSQLSITTKAQKLGLTARYVRKNSSTYKAEYNDFNWCFERFVTRCMTIEDIAEESGYSKRVLEKWIYEKHNINYKRDFKLTDRQRMMVISGCLGDGHIMKDVPVYVESHAENQKDYICWKLSILSNMCHMKKASYYPPSIKIIDGKPSSCQAFYRISTREIEELGLIKAMSRMEMIGCLDAFGFSTHFLDDGYFNGCQWEICLAEWRREEKDFYMKNLRRLFNVNSYYAKDDRYIRLDSRSSATMNRIILQNVPNNLDIIQRKIIGRLKNE